ncbi:cytochrome P450 2B4-like isoform X3 [Ruditapes philippinarum]|uniref:cytochrome P450 2B4-like isoform X3 n=1 Tax=Ruditapes philippinarum TaxID=129788 RepID=UPI00295A9DCD|nr:cytochrome P450 2B4-like isoform X3 [Ruditapes philippinarum]
MQVSSQCFHPKIMDLTIAFVFIVAFLVSAVFLRRPKNLPPGYSGIPYIGSVQMLLKFRGKRPHIVLEEESKRLGNIFRWYLGNQLIVVLSGYDIIHEALVKKADTFSNRILDPRDPVFSNEGGESGILTGQYDQCWKVLRRFTLQALRDFGVGKASIEEKIAVEVETATEYLEGRNGKPTSMNDLMQKVVANVIFEIIICKRYEYDDPEFHKIQALTNIVLSGAGAVSPSAFMPKFLVKLVNRKDFDITESRWQSVKKMREYVFQQIEEHEATFDRDNIRDFVDLYIQTKTEGDEIIRKFVTKGNMFRVIFDLFLAGLETTSTTLDWAFLFMTEFPEVQKKCQDEIDKVLGDKIIEYSDRTKLTYVNAVIMEIQRCAHLAPLSAPHGTSADTSLGGYNIPAKTMIIPSLYSVHMDTKYFSNPEKFDPDRFLDGHGNLLKNEALLPFSTGPRVCIGEPLARMELFLVFVYLIKRFNFAREDPNKPHTLESKHSQSTNAPLPYKLRATKRN